MKLVAPYAIVTLVLLHYLTDPFLMAVAVFWPLVCPVAFVAGIGRAMWNWR